MFSIKIELKNENGNLKIGSSIIHERKVCFIIVDDFCSQYEL